MKKNLSNVVLYFESQAEKAKVEKVLKSRGYCFEMAFDYVEVYQELPIQEWSALIDEINRG